MDFYFSSLSSGFVSPSLVSSFSLVFPHLLITLSSVVQIAGRQQLVCLDHNVATVLSTLSGWIEGVHQCNPHPLIVLSVYPRSPSPPPVTSSVHAQYQFSSSLFLFTQSTTKLPIYSILPLVICVSLLQFVLCLCSFHVRWSACKSCGIF